MESCSYLCRSKLKAKAQFFSTKSSFDVVAVKSLFPGKGKMLSFMTGKKLARQSSAPLPSEGAMVAPSCSSVADRIHKEALKALPSITVCSVHIHTELYQELHNLCVPSTHSIVQRSNPFIVGHARIFNLFSQRKEPFAFWWNYNKNNILVQKSVGLFWNRILNRNSLKCLSYRKKTTAVTNPTGRFMYKFVGSLKQREAKMVQKNSILIT